MQVVVIGPNLQDQSKGDFHVHEASCADVKRSPLYQFPDYKSDKENPIEVLDKATVGEYVYADFIPDEMSVADAVADCYFFPCCSDLPLGEV